MRTEGRAARGVAAPLSWRGYSEGYPRVPGQAELDKWMRFPVAVLKFSVQDES